MFKTRPHFITLVCLYLLIWGTYQLCTSFSYLNRDDVQEAMLLAPLPVYVQEGVLYLNFLVMIVTSIFMFQEASWARWVYLGWEPVHLGYLFFLDHDWHKLIIPVAIYLCSLMILIVPSANEYFSEDVY